MAGFETDEEYTARHRVADTTDPFWARAVAELPDGYEIVTEGETREGDIAYGAFLGWGLDHPYTRPEFDQVLNCGVGHFHAIARKGETR